MTQESMTDVLICGAGAAGLALAIDLARRGVDFRLIDKAATPFRGSRGKGIQPRSLEVFGTMGSSTGCSRPEARIRRYANTAGTAVLPMHQSATPAAPHRPNRIARRSWCRSSSPKQLCASVSPNSASGRSSAES